MRTYFDCIPCLCRQAIDALRLVTDDEALHERVLREVLRIASQMDLRKTPAEMGGVIHRMIRQATGNPDPYAEQKKRCNRLALELYPKLKQRVAGSADPLETAARLAIAGNIIDMGVKSGFKESHVRDSIEHCLTAPLDRGALGAFRGALVRAKNVVFLADNAGEIVFDKLLLEFLPCEKVTFVVKGSPVINDATMEDARMTGIMELVEVIDNGTDMPGTVLESCSDAFRKRFAAADLIVAKGQGNYETLSDVPGDIFFLFKVKCPTVSRHAGCEVGSIVLMQGAHARETVGGRETPSAL